MSNLFAGFGTAETLIYILFCIIAGLVGYLIADHYFSKKNKALEADFSAQKMELDTVKIQNETLAKQIKLATPEAEVNDLRNRLKSALDDKIKSDGAYASQTDGAEKLKAQLSALMNERDQLKADVHANTSMSEGQIAEVQDTLNKTKDKITEIAAENDSLRKELDAYKNAGIQIPNLAPVKTDHPAAETPSTDITVEPHPELPGSSQTAPSKETPDSEPLKTPYGAFDVNKEPALSAIVSGNGQSASASEITADGATISGAVAETPKMTAPVHPAPDATIPPSETASIQPDILQTPYGAFPVHQEPNPANGAVAPEISTTKTATISSDVPVHKEQSPEVISTDSNTHIDGIAAVKTETLPEAGPSHEVHPLSIPDSNASTSGSADHHEEFHGAEAAAPATALPPVHPEIQAVPSGDQTLHTDSSDSGAHKILPVSAPEISAATIETPPAAFLPVEHPSGKVESESATIIPTHDAVHPEASSPDDSMKTPYGNVPLNGFDVENTSNPPVETEPHTRDLDIIPATPIPTLFQPAEPVHSDQAQHTQPDYSHTDDLKRIEGISAEAEEALKKAGIHHWRELSVVSVARLKAILSDGDVSLKNNDPTYWPEQAIYLANGEYDKFENLKQYLTGRNDVRS